MKLYTEEQVRIIIDEAREYDNGYATKEDILNLVVPIELPNDEEIEEVSNIRLLYLTDKSANFRLGAKWMKEQILNQNK